MRGSLLKKRMTWMLFLLIPFVFAFQVRAEEPEEAEWTVMFYFCGSDLESKYSFATGNLEEIASVVYPDSVLSNMTAIYGEKAKNGQTVKPGQVNVVLQTGGSKEWHSGDLGMDVKTDALQRWRYHINPEPDVGEEERSNYELLETLPLDSMADPGTLCDFIRWGAEVCPAKKYALVLWDHGGGAKTGLFIDELFKGDIMYLYEVKQALKDSGVHLTDLIIDACMMANMETAWAVKDSADYLIASEEVVPGKGTAIDRWLQALVGYPTCDGEWLGRTICDMTDIKYANENDLLSRSLLTWSVIDLKMIDPLVSAADELFRTMDKAFTTAPGLIVLYSSFIFKADEYGDGKQNMRDFGSVINNPDTIGALDASLRAKILKALSDAILYSTRGSGRTEAMGLSFCYPADFNNDELDIYAKNFPLPSYLAFLDAISSWTAPDEVYEKMERLPEADTIDELSMEIKMEMSPDGMPAISIPEWNFNSAYYRLYQLNEETGEVVRLGRTACSMEFPEGDETDILFRAKDPMHWPAVEGQLCCIDLVQNQNMRLLYNIPVQIDSDTYMFRCGRRVDYSEEGERTLNDYEIFGVWDGYDEDSDLLNRSVTSLAMLSGRDYKLLYPIDDGSVDDREFYETGETRTLYRALRVEEIPLPAGTYYLEYEVQDIFKRPTLLKRIEIHWDGEKMTFPEDFKWEGTVETHKNSSEEAAG